MRVDIKNYLAWTGRDRVRRKGGFYAPERMNTLLEASNVDLLVVTSADNIAYLSNFDSCAARIIFSPVVMLFARSRPSSSYLIFPIYELADYVECVSVDVKPWCYSAGRFRYFTDIAGGLENLCTEVEKGVGQLAAEVPCAEDPFEALEGAIGALGFSTGMTVALEDGGLPFWMRQRVGSIFAGGKLVDGESLMRNLRAKKNPSEVVLLEQASAINNRAMAKAVEQIRPGVTEVQLARSYSESVWAEGAEVSWAIIKAGPGSALTHAHSTDYALRNGDLVRFELGCRYSGYYSDVGRSYVVGKATDEQKAIFAGLRAGFMGAVEALRPGVKARDVFRAELSAVHATGFRDYRRGFIGHGCGMFLYDLPLVTETSDETIESQMVLAIELPYYRLGFGGMQLEAQVVVEENGASVLGDFSQTLELKN